MILGYPGKKDSTQRAANGTKTTFKKGFSNHYSTREDVTRAIILFQK